MESYFRAFTASSRLSLNVKICERPSRSKTSFTFGLITAIASQIPTCDPGRVQREVDGHIYANDGHTILATLRGSESRILIGTNDVALQQFTESRLG